MATLVMNKRKLQNLAQVFEEENRTDSGMVQSIFMSNSSQHKKQP